MASTSERGRKGPVQSDAISPLLLGWYDSHARVLPWRVSPSDIAKGVRPDPYRVWLSEIMLQQTTVAAVKAYFEKFVATWPTVDDLAGASDDSVMAAWAGLGYYSRARNLLAAARQVSKAGGGFPTDAAGLKTLPGVGDYTSAAIAAIAFDQSIAVIDGNVERVASRLVALDEPVKTAKKLVHRFVSDITPSQRPGDFAQAMMDLGATICTPKRPACALCPINAHCIAFREGPDPASLPIKLPKKARPARLAGAYIAERSSDGAIMLVRRPSSGLLGGMAGPYLTDFSSKHDGETGEIAAPFEGDWIDCGLAEHGFTHFQLTLEVMWARIDGKSALPDGAFWCPRDKLSDAALPTVMKKAIVAAIPDAFR
ncbi:A/G-specific adenine glycosylase [Notoacmeibacter sp. MSK16QG-6]|uniref:A/G-specific adenine glycosylase n=1 Tax=Notoacmeibacter sp. MSK16QG-6 TaxID=2957982 RepID=UPI00209DCF25|nr:A/G-specific adenine glycosylase [Notoacmeibacter sp. MSK16QG-6]MCP1198205.1 A/G-specific adenine glycosylase [Notoacmeibacter sp. MSK16QG-6]